MSTELLESGQRSGIPLRMVAKTEFANLERREHTLLRQRSEIDAQLDVIVQLKKTYASYEPSLRSNISRQPRARRIGDTLRLILEAQPGEWFTLTELQDAVTVQFPGVQPTVTNVRNAMTYILRKDAQFRSEVAIHGIQYTFSEPRS